MPGKKPLRELNSARGIYIPNVEVDSKSCLTSLLSTFCRPIILRSLRPLPFRGLTRDTFTPARESVGAL